MAMMGAEPAVEILYRKEIESASDPEKFREEKIRQYRDTFSTPYHSASKQLIDVVIDPRDTRKVIIDALLMLENKRAEEMPWRKHGIMPV
jgi:methylmalonyl-CoA carboxyltransferase large subunit